MLIASALLCLGAPSVASPLWQVSYTPAPNGAGNESTATPIGPSLLVTVVTPGTNTSQATVRVGDQNVSARLIGYDPVSSLAFLKTEGSVPASSQPWLDKTNVSAGTVLSAPTSAGPVQCRVTGWVNQVGTKILPLALIQITFVQAVPSPGTPLLDSQGRVAAILFQKTTSGNGAYAIPSQAVHRVRRDIGTGGHLARGWLGFSLLAENKTPKIVQVLPNSPAAAAGIKPSDVLLTVGDHKISQYSDAPNAFFYLIPGQPVRITLLRGEKQQPFILTPTRPPAN